MTENENKPAVPHALPIGYRFNEFEIKEVIGGGGFGIVYRAWDHQLERTIAIKEFMPASLAVRGEDMKLVLRSERFSKTFSAGLNSFIQEARLLARFNHPNLLRVLRFWVQNDTAYMGTLFCSGTTLSRLQASHPELINEAWIRHLLPMLFGAIKTLHDEGYLHRDISLDNIQIQDNGQPILLDFGSARRTIGNLSDETETMLRPGFAPIEQYTDDNENDSDQGPWTDIYALGAVLRTLIIGTTPPASVVRSIQDTCEPLAKLRPAGYSLPLLQAVDCALALHMTDRPQSIDELATLIGMPINSHSNVHTEKKVSPTPAPVAAAVPEEKVAVKKQSWQRFRLPALIAGGVLVGVAAGAILFSGDDSPDVTAANPVASPPTTTTTTTPQPQESVSTAPTNPPAIAAQPIARVYVNLTPGESLKVNGEAKALSPAANGYASLELPQGQYTFEWQSEGQTRTQSLAIAQAGTWLLRP